MTDDQLLLANAYVDDDVDDAARARAEADPEVMAEVERLRTLRTELRDVGTPDAARRERTIAAALAAFADEPAPVAPTAPVPLPHRRRSAWWGGALAAAAALIVVVAGAVVLRGAGDSSDGDDSAAEATVDRLTAAADTEDAEDADAGAATAPADAARPASTESASESATEATSTADAPAPQLAEPDAVLATPEDLATYARAAADSSGSLSVVPVCRLPGTFVGRASYDGRPVEVFVDGDVITALDATTCAVVVLVGP